MGTIEDAVRGLVEFILGAPDLHPIAAGRCAEAVRAILAPIEAELAAAREAVECVGLIHKLCPSGCLAGIQIAIGDGGRVHLVQHSHGMHHGDTLLAALRAAEKGQEERDERSV